MTRAGQGLGRAIALEFARVGAEVVVNDVRDDRALAVVAELVSRGGRALASVFDVGDYDGVRSSVEDIGAIDVLVYNAGNAGAGGRVELVQFVETEPPDWDRYLRVNLVGVMNTCRVVLPGMIANGWGRIVTIVSDAGRAGGAGTAAYSAAKAGAAGLTRSLALEAGRHGVTANNISLGTMRTSPLDPAADDQPNPRLDAVLKRYVVRRPGVPGDVVPLVLLLASDHASWITGQTYAVNGGFTFSM